MLPCKVGNTSIKAALATALGRPTRRLHSDGAWDYRSPAEIASLDWLVIGFVRQPFARFLSAYRHRIRDEGRHSDAGFDRCPTIEEVAAALPRITDQHWRSLSADLTHDGRVVPSLVVKTDDMADAWGAVRDAVHRHCGLSLPPIPHLNRTNPGGDLAGRARALVREHYAEDFERFGYT